MYKRRQLKADCIFKQTHQNAEIQSQHVQFSLASRKGADGRDLLGKVFSVYRTLFEQSGGGGALSSDGRRDYSRRFSP